MVANQHATMTAGLDTDLWTKVLVLIDLICLSWMECRSCAVWDQIWSWFVQTGLQLPYVPTQEIWQEIWTGSCVRQLWWWWPTMAPRASRVGTPTWPTCNHPPKNKPFFICTYTGVYVSFLYIFIFWLCSWTIKCLSPVGHTHSALNLTLNKNSPGSTQHVTSENPYQRACALCGMPSANTFHNFWAHDHIWENSILFVLGGDMSKHVINVWLMCSERVMNVWLMHD